MDLQRPTSLLRALLTLLDTSGHGGLAGESYRSSGGSAAWMPRKGRPRSGRGEAREGEGQALFITHAHSPNQTVESALRAPRGQADGQADGQAAPAHELAHELAHTLPTVWSWKSPTAEGKSSHNKGCKKAKSGRAKSHVLRTEREGNIRKALPRIEATLHFCSGDPALLVVLPCTFLQKSA